MTRKKSLLLVSLFLVFGLATMATSAFGQAFFNVGSSINKFGRAEGKAEWTGDVILTTTNTFSVTVTAGNNFTFSYGETFDTNGYATDDIPVVPGSEFLTCTGSLTPCSSFFGTPYITTPNAVTLGLSPNTAPNTVVVPVLPSVIPIGTATFEITVRLNVSGLYPGPGAIAAEATTYYTGTPSVNIAGAISSPQRVLIVNKEPALKLSWGVFCFYDEEADYYEHCRLSQFAQVLLCLGVVTNDRQYTQYFTVNVAESFQYALTSEAYEDQQDPGSSSPGLVTNGTEITVVLSGLPSKFGIAAGEPIACGEISPGTDAAYTCSPGTLYVELSPGISGPWWNPGPGNSGVETFEYIVDDMDNNKPENVNLPFKVYSAGPITSEPAGAVPCVQMSIFKNPNDSQTGTQYDVPLFVAKAEGGSPLSVICFDNCETNLLWPFVANVAGWDFDIAISNTTLDPLAWIGANPPTGYSYDWELIKGSATPQTGACDLFFFANGTTPWVNKWNTGPIVPGSTWAQDTGASGTVPAGDTGYVWGKCYFSQAYGYGLLNWNIGLGSGVAADYLAITIPNPERSPRDLNGDGMSENATTPIDLSRLLQKWLSGLWGGCCI